MPKQPQRYCQSTKRYCNCPIHPEFLWDWVDFHCPVNSRRVVEKGHAEDCLVPEISEAICLSLVHAYGYKCRWKKCQCQESDRFHCSAITLCRLSNLHWDSAVVLCHCIVSLKNVSKNTPQIWLPLTRVISLISLSLFAWALYFKLFMTWR